MHVVYIMGQDSGGLPHYTAELANAVANHADVTVLKPSETSADEIFDSSVQLVEVFKPTNISMQNIHNFDIGLRKTSAGLYSFRNIKIIKELSPDIVHDPTDEFPQVSLFSYLYKIHEQQPYVITSHEVEHGGSGGVLKLADLVLSAIPDFDKAAAVVHSEQQRDMLASKNRNINSVHVIPHGVYSFFKKLDYIKREEEDNHILFFGSLIPPKGLEFLLKAVPHIEEQLPDFTLTIAGSGELPSGCDQVLQEYADSITIWNEFIPNDQVGELFSRAQVVALPYRKGWQTGHSGTLSTAFAFGKPVVASAVGDFTELVSNSGAGVVVEPENPKALAEGLVEVLSDEKRRMNMARASEQVAEELSWDNVAKKHMVMYQEILEESQT